MILSFTVLTCDFKVRVRIVLYKKTGLYICQIREVNAPIHFWLVALDSWELSLELKKKSGRKIFFHHGEFWFKKIQNIYKIWKFSKFQNFIFLNIFQMKFSMMKKYFSSGFFFKFKRKFSAIQRNQPEVNRSIIEYDLKPPEKRCLFFVKIDT